jgi:hypothetical protein
MSHRCIPMTSRRLQALIGTVFSRTCLDMPPMVVQHFCKHHNAPVAMPVASAYRPARPARLLDSMSPRD